MKQREAGAAAIVLLLVEGMCKRILAAEDYNQAMARTIELDQLVRELVEDERDASE